MKKPLIKAKLFPWIMVGVLALVAGILATLLFPVLRDTDAEITYTVVDYAMPAPELGIVLDEKFNVVHVVPGGAAEIAGVKKGDVLKSINAQELTSIKNSAKTIMRIKTSANIDKSVSLVLSRGGSEIKLDIKPAYNGGVLGSPTATPVPQGMYYF